VLRAVVPMDDEPTLTVAEAAERLRLNPETVRVWLRQGKLKGVRLGGTKAGYRIPASEITRLLRGEDKPPA
jgi:excisionase family DNA binding protein